MFRRLPPASSSRCALKKGDRVSKGTLIGQLEGSGGGAAAQAARRNSRLAPSISKAQSEKTARAERTETAPAKLRRLRLLRLRPACSRQSSPACRSSTKRASPVRMPVRRSASSLANSAPISAASKARARRVASPGRRQSFVKQALTSGVCCAAAGGGAGLPKIPEVDFSKFGAIEAKPLSRIQKISGPRLQASWLNVPHVWQMDEADITELEEARNQLKAKAAKEGIKLTPLAFILRACVKALQEFPNVNSSLDASGQNLILKKYIHLGFAADTPNGLVVPVIRDADKKDVYEIARELAVLSEKARAGKLDGRRNARRAASPCPAWVASAARLHADHQCARSCDPRRRALAA